MKTMNDSNTLRILTAQEGYVLTQAGDVDIINRVLSKKIYLAVTDSPENWKEITDAEAEAILIAQEAYAKEQQKMNE